jgi:cell division protease FtsH
LAQDVNLEKIARGTPGFSGADLENLVNEAALIAARKDQNKITQRNFEDAKDKVMMGTERRSMVISEEDKLITAYHEAGHAIVGRMIPGTDPIHKVTIIPRGMALGLTQILPEKDKLNLTKTAAQDMIAFLFGGRAAEEIIYNEITTGAGNDIERATGIARSMVCEWGMSEKLGPLAWEKKEGNNFLGMSQSSNNYSEAKSEQIDQEVFDIVTSGHKRALRILGENRPALKMMADALVLFETIDGAEVDMLCKGATLDDIKRERGIRESEMAKDQASGKKEVKADEDRKKAGGDDPVGNSGPVTA